MEKLILIPARYGSTRFPGKPLAKINGKEMILHVCEGCAKTGYDMYVVTDDSRIVDVVTKAGFTCVVIKGDYMTGSDRVAGAAKIFDHDIIINVQGDEPLVDYRDIINVADKCVALVDSPVNLCKSTCDVLENQNTIKVVTKNNGQLLYMSRSKIPFKSITTRKQVGIYAYPRNVLAYCFGKGRVKSHLELNEDVEILRFIDFGEKVFVIETKNKYQAVDTPEDIKKVEDILNGV